MRELKITLLNPRNYGYRMKMDILPYDLYKNLFLIAGWCYKNIVVINDYESKKRL